ncbi:MAG TPA: alpha/beta fold hydrolase [Nitrospiria bacterium]|nr:alpha/beta fold hydrolase [Nitrospiria bacterium]
MKRRFLAAMVVTVLSVAALLAWGTAAMSSPAQRRGETVVVLHGLLTSPWHMKRIELALAREGFDVVNWGYDSRAGTIEDHARALHEAVRALPPDRPVHFVGFSLGSLIIRYYLGHYEVPHAVRFVMIGPPNHGSELADFVFPAAWFRALAGSDATSQLRASNHAFFDALGTPPVDVGIIAGGRGDDSGFSNVLPGDDDGRVSVESARLDGAKDFIVLPHRHVILLVANDAIHQIVRFITSGRFDHDLAADALGSGRAPMSVGTNLPLVGILPVTATASRDSNTGRPMAHGDSP